MASQVVGMGWFQLTLLGVLRMRLMCIAVVDDRLLCVPGFRYHLVTDDNIMSLCGTER
jgi:hypothetical protein